MRICVFEDAGVQDLRPLTLTRPAFDLRCGAASLLERQERWLSGRASAVLVRPELTDLCRLEHPHLAVNEPAAGDGWDAEETVVWVNARWLAPAPSLPPPQRGAVGLAGDQVAYAVLSAGEARGLSPHALPRLLSEWRDRPSARPAGGKMIDYPWDLVESNAAALEDDHRHWWAAGVPEGHGLSVRGPAERCLVAHTAEVEPMVQVDTTGGPVLIDRGAVVQAFSRLQGPCYVGPGTRLLGARLSGGSIGPDCRIGGEVEASIVHGHSNKAHAGFLGHSYVGEWVNLAAGTHTSDLRTDYAPVRVRLEGRTVETGLLKVGSFLGDHTRTSLNALLNVGSLVGAFGQLLGDGELLPRRVPSFCRYRRGRLQECGALRELFETAATVMARRGRRWTDVHAERFFALFEETAAERHHVLREQEQARLRRVV